MNSSTNVVILSVVTLTLASGIGWYVLLNPGAATWIAPVLAAVALIIHAIAGSPQPPADE